jgi:MFS family permease
LDLADSTIVATLTAVISTSFSSFNNLSWLGTLLCGVATSEGVFILGRVIAGAGGGAMNAVSTFV